jgi:hypothetical protein
MNAANVNKQSVENRREDSHSRGGEFAREDNRVQ